MKCPVLTHNEKWVSGGIEYIPKDCIKEGCAWWDEEQQRCDPTGLVHWIRALIAELWAIKEKMPCKE